MAAVTEVPFKEGTMWSYDGQLYDKYEDIPFKTKQAYETAKSGLGTAAKTTWEGIGNIPKVGQPTQHLLKNAAQVAAGTIQDLDEQEFKIPFTDIKTGIPTPGNLAVDALRIADKTLTAGSKLAEKEFGIYAPTTKLAGEIAVDYLASGGAGKVVKGAKGIASQVDNLIPPPTGLAYATVGVGAGDGHLLRQAALDKLPSSATPLQIASNMQSPGWQGSVRTLLKEKNSNQIKNILKKPYHKELSKKYQYFSMDNLAQDKGGWLSTLIGKADRIKSDLTDYMNLSRRGISKGRLATEQRKGYDRFTNNPLFEEKNIYDNPIRQKVAETFNTVLGKEWHHIFGNKEAGEFMLAQVGQDPYIAVNMIHHLKRLDLPTGGTASNIALMNKALHRKKGGFHSWYKKIGGEAKGKKKGVLQIDDYGQAISEAILEGKTSIDEYFSIIESYAKFNKYQRTKLKTEFGAEVVGEMGPVMKFIEGA